MRTLALVLLNLTLWTLPVQAQLWSGILDPSRATNWSSAGATIVDRTTQCGSTIAAYSGSAVTINNAIAACSANQYVHLGTGTFNLSSGIDFSGKNSVTLRGDGPNNTSLVFTGSASCNGSDAVVCIRTPANWSVASPPHSATVSGTLTAGSTSLTFSSTTTLAVGTIVVLDQLNDSDTDTGGVWVNTTVGVCCDEGGCSHCRTSGGPRGTQQVVTVTAINGSTVTFTPGLYASYWTSSKSPGAAWGDGQIAGVGVEALAVNVSGAGSVNGFTFFGARDSWLRAVSSYNAGRAHVDLFEATGITVRDSYFDEGQGHQSQSYGIENYVSSDCLIENNIWHHVTTPISVNGSASGCVYSYNYDLNNTFFAGQMSGFAWMHEGGIDTLLFEGNDMAAWFSDSIHGTHHFVTLFRNQSRGWESGLTGQTVPILVHLGGRFYNVIGNVLGTNTYHTTYQTQDVNTTIYDLGVSTTARPNDSLVASTMMRWGNYDTVNDATRFLSSEVPSGLAKYANPVPGSQTLPNSFYLSTKPSWFGSGTWPPIGPDVTGGFDSSTGNHVRKIPARLCYENSSKDGNGRLTAFNPDTCYGTSGGSSTDTVPPGSPQNVSVS